MTLDLLIKCTGQAKRKREESQEQYLRRITHLYCAEKGIEKIVSCKNDCIALMQYLTLQSPRRVCLCVAL